MLGLLDALRFNGSKATGRVIAEQLNANWSKPWLAEESVCRIACMCGSLGYVDVSSYPAKPSIETRIPTPNSRTREFHRIKWKDWTDYTFRLTKAGEILANAFLPLSYEGRERNWVAEKRLTQNFDHRERLSREEKTASGRNSVYWLGFEPTLQLLPHLTYDTSGSHLSWWESKMGGWGQLEISQALLEYNYAGFIKTEIGKMPPEHKIGRNVIKIEVTPAGDDFAEAILKAEAMVRTAQQRNRPDKILRKAILVLPQFG